MSNQRSNNLAPIVLFTYNRLYHTKQTIKALSKNELASQSELFIYNDNVKDSNDVEAKKKVDEVRAYLKTIENNGSFKNVTIIQREKNWGLGNSIIDGVTDIVNRYDKIIVLEDDLISSPYYLNFMNDALIFYEDKKRVWHISGWNYPVKLNQDDDIFMCRIMNCLGWATWSDRWQYFEKDTDSIIESFSKKDIEELTLGGLTTSWDQVMANKKGLINTWAVYWYILIFRQNGLCVNPTLSYIQNIGHDGTGTNSNDTSYIDNTLLNQKQTVIFDSNIEEKKEAFEKLKIFLKSLKKPFLQRVINKCIKVLKV